MAIKTSSAKDKGRIFQQTIRDVYIRLAQIACLELPESYIRESIESRQMGGAGEDVRFMVKELREAFPYYVECKQQKTGFNPHLFFAKLAETAKKKSLVPILFHRRDRHETLVTMELKHYEKLMEELWRRRTDGLDQHIVYRDADRNSAQNR